MPQLDTQLIGKVLSNCTDGKIPKLFKLIPSMINWEDILYLTEPEKWSPNAMYQAVRIFASNMGVKRAECFYKLVLLPRVREDIRKNKRLHFALYQSLKKCVYKPGAFYKGILFPLCESKTCNLREAVIIGSIIQKVSIPLLHSSVALLKLVDMEYCGTTSYFIKIILEKKYALTYRALDALVAHFVRFLDDTRIMPVIWHQSLLALVQKYKNELQKEDKVKLRAFLEKQNHKLITPEITRELNNSRNRVEKEDDLMLIDILCLQGSLRCCSIPYLADDLLGRVFDECPDIKILKKLHSKIFFDQHLHQNPSLAIKLMRGYAANEETRITHHIFDFDEMSVKNVVFFNVMMV
ncbi:bystin-like [Cannabis sativa]|uniref:bystin-like n=1 Tax=Cannabis sativa TaxID=3483 RepID=UPI0029CA8AF3|nr:bystin-like [Cannabis sativa]